MKDEKVGAFAIELARKSVAHFLAEKKVLPSPDPEDIPDIFQRRAGVFVTLRKKGELRGCIGTISPQTSGIAEEIIRNAVSSATRDPRFPPVRPEELPDITFSVDVLGEPEPAHSLEDLNPSIYGVIVRYEGRSGLLLPDIEGVDRPEDQIEIARQKAGIPGGAPLQIERFKVDRYGKK